MNPGPCRVGVRVLVVATVLGMAPCPAALPDLKEPPWLGHFLAFANKKFTFGLSSMAEGKLTPMGRSGKPINFQMVLPVAFVVEEVLPNGRTITKKLLPDTLTTKDAATAKPGHVSFRGMVTGGASFEGRVEVEHGVVAAGGRLLDAGTLTKNPLRFGVRVTFPNAYRNQPKTDKRAARAFENLLKEDRLSLVRTDGKRVRLTGLDKVGPVSSKINSPDIAEIKIDIGAYQGKVFEFTATQHSRLDLSNRLEQAVHEGFVLTWYPDPTTDPEGNARFKFEVK